MFWPLDEEWYEAVVAGFEPVTARHSLKYKSDAEVGPPLVRLSVVCLEQGHACLQR